MNKVSAKGGLIICIWILCLLLFCAGCTETKQDEQALPGDQTPVISVSISEVEQTAIERTKYPITDALGRTVFIPGEVNHIICSGAGCLRYLTYLNATDKVVGIDMFEQNNRPIAPVAYLLAHPELRTLPVFGDKYGADNPAAIRGLASRPDLIFKIADDEMSPARVQMLQDLTGIPVIALKYGDLTTHKGDMNYALRVMGATLGKTDRAQELIQFIDRTVEILNDRVSLIAPDDRKIGYIGGIYHKNPQDLLSTDPDYEPFILAGVLNVNAQMLKEEDKWHVSRTSLIEQSPDALFVDLSTLLLEDNAVTELLRTGDGKSNEYRDLVIKIRGNVYGVPPYDLYGADYASGLANAFFIGKILYPERFSDIDPVEMADYMYMTFYGVPLFDKMNIWFEKRMFQPIKG
jgi:iron complex transport system substrate-binding protein